MCLAGRIVWYSNDFTGHWPVGTAMIIAADTLEEAYKEADGLCRDNGLMRTLLPRFNEKEILSYECN